MSVSIEEVRHVASLANLELLPDEATRMQRDLNDVLGYIAQLNELDTSSVEAMAQVGDILGIANDGFGTTLRVDEARPSVDRRAVMAEAPQTDGRFFKVPKVIER